MYFESKFTLKLVKSQSEKLVTTLIQLYHCKEHKVFNLLDDNNEDSFPQRLSYIRGLLLSQYKKIN